MKECSKCKETKPLTEFYKDKLTKDGFQYRCKSCIKKYYIENIEIKKQYYKKYYTENKEELINYKKKYYIENKERQLELNKKWRIENKEYLKKHNKYYNRKNRERRNKYIRKKRKEDPLYKLKDNVKSRIRGAMKINNKTKSMRTIDYLGCTIYFYKKYLEERFKQGMSWDNRLEWHIDHIIPLASAKTEEELIKLFHYTNTQPLWAEENIKKGSKIL